MLRAMGAGCCSWPELHLQDHQHHPDHGTTSRPHYSGASIISLMSS